MRKGLSRHPLANQFRVVCASGAINGRPAPLPPIKQYDRTYAGLKEREMRRVSNKTPAQIERYRLGAVNGWLKRRAR